LERFKRSEAMGTTRFQHQMHSNRPWTQQQQEHTQKPPDISNSQHATNSLSQDSGAANPSNPTPNEQDKAASKAVSHEPKEASEDPLDALLKVKRDPGVSDAVWEQLERDKHALIAGEREYKQRQEEKKKEEQRIKDLIRAVKAAAQDEERRRLEKARIEAELRRRQRDAEMAAIERQRAVEREMQKKIRMMGPCPMGFRWIKGSGGYRCAGGNHWLSDAQINARAV
jgi:hypothetical protein